VRGTIAAVGCTGRPMTGAAKKAQSNEVGILFGKKKKRKNRGHKQVSPFAIKLIRPIQARLPQTIRRRVKGEDMLVEKGKDSHLVILVF